MELVGGIPITAHCDAHRLSARDRIGLFLDVCAAIRHAHQKGVIHRDLKPSNVLVASSGDGPRVKVIDFGITKALDLDQEGRENVTLQGTLIGTPQYMSPEQTGLDQGDVDTRSDKFVDHVPKNAGISRVAACGSASFPLRNKTDKPLPSIRCKNSPVRGCNLMPKMQMHMSCCRLILALVMPCPPALASAGNDYLRIARAYADARIRAPAKPGQTGMSGLR